MFSHAHSDDSHVDATVPHCLCAVAQAHPKMSCICVVGVSVPLSSDLNVSVCLSWTVNLP